MWVNLLKFVTVLFLNRKVSALKDNFVHLREHFADYTEHRAQYLRQDFLGETDRLATSIVGLLVVFSMFIFTGLLGLMWLFSLLWQHPHRSLILGLAMLVPAIIAIVAFLSVRALWKKKPLFADTLAMISHDWNLFRNEIAPEQPPQSEAAEADQEESTQSATR